MLVVHGVNAEGWCWMQLLRPPTMFLAIRCRFLLLCFSLGMKCTIIWEGCSSSSSLSSSELCLINLGSVKKLYSQTLTFMIILKSDDPALGNHLQLIFPMLWFNSHASIGTRMIDYHASVGPMDDDQQIRPDFLWWMSSS